MLLNKIFTLHLGAFIRTYTAHDIDMMHRQTFAKMAAIAATAPPTTSSECACVFAFAICVFEVAFAYQLCSASMIHSVLALTMYKVFQEMFGFSIDEEI